MYDDKTVALPTQPQATLGNATLYPPHSYNSSPQQGLGNATPYPSYPPQSPQTSQSSYQGVDQYSHPSQGLGNATPYLTQPQQSYHSPQQGINTPTPSDSEVCVRVFPNASLSLVREPGVNSWLFVTLYRAMFPQPDIMLSAVDLSRLAQSVKSSLFLSGVSPSFSQASFDIASLGVDDSAEPGEFSEPVSWGILSGYARNVRLPRDVARALLHPSSFDRVVSVVAVDGEVSVSAFTLDVDPTTNGVSLRTNAFSVLSSRSTQNVTALANYCLGLPFQDAVRAVEGISANASRYAMSQGQF